MIATNPRIVNNSTWRKDEVIMTLCEAMTPRA
jgi:hypothetical protein